MADDETKRDEETPEAPEASEQAEPPAAEETPAEQPEQPVAEEATPAPEAEEAAPVAEEEPAATEEPAPVAEPKAEEPKKDVIPGADLEPIAVEPDGPELSAEERARLEAEEEEKARREAEPCGAPVRSGDEKGSIIVVIATDAPLLPGQLKRVAKRASLGIARMGGIGGDGSGDLFVAFSTANAAAAPDTGLVTATFIPNDVINPVFEAAVDATSEAILNALLAAQTMTGADGYRVFGLPHDRLMTALRKYGRVK